jgi:hypothetical protein
MKSRRRIGRPRSTALTTPYRQPITAGIFGQRNGSSYQVAQQQFCAPEVVYGSFATGSLSVHFARCPQYSESRHQVSAQYLQRWAITRPSASQQKIAYSITWLASDRKDSGIVRPIAFAVVRLTTSSNLVGCSIGMSAGLAPRNILSTNSAARRNMSGIIGP